jgi:hypothetical protein
MQRAIAVTRWIVRLAGLIQIALGLTFWTGHALSLVSVHMVVGMVVVLGLWATAYFAARAGTRASLVTLAVIWGLVLPVFGVTHARFLPGSLHWVIRLAHLVIGVGALRLAEVLADSALRPGAANAPRESGSGAGRRRLGASRATP